MITKRCYAIDFVKFFAAFAVVCIHTKPFSEVTVFGGDYIFFFINTLARFAVPFFFVVSGFLFIKKIIKCDDTDYFVKYSVKVSQLYFGWMLFYYLYYIGQALLVSYIQHTNFSSPWIPELSIIPIIKLLIRIFYIGYAGAHLWYLISVLWSIGILYLFIKYRKLNTLLFLSFMLNILGLFGNSYQGVIHFPVPTRNAIFFGLFYCTLGGFCAYHEKMIFEKVSRVGVSIFGYLFWVFCGAQLLERAILIESFQGKMGDDFFVTTIPLSICLFFWVLGKRDFLQKSFFTVVGEKSLGIYVIHIFIIGLSKSIGVKLGVSSGTVIYQLLFTPFVFAVSYFAYLYLGSAKSWINSLVIPFAKKYGRDYTG